MATFSEADTAAPSDADVFELTARLPEGREIPIRAGDLAAFGEFWTTPEHQGDLIAREPAAAKTALADGGILTANFHRGLDGSRMVNYAQLNDAKAVTRLAAKPGFKPADGYWSAFARNEFRVYEVRRVLLS